MASEAADVRLMPPPPPKATKLHNVYCVEETEELPDGEVSQQRADGDSGGITGRASFSSELETVRAPTLHGDTL
jgi:hypothetical protein